MGYWHATPTGAKENRQTTAKEDGLPIELPDIRDLERLWQAWIDAGMSVGNTPLPWSEIAAFASIASLDREDKLILRAMSESYVDGLSMVSPLSKTPLEIDAERRLVD